MNAVVRNIRERLFRRRDAYRRTFCGPGVVPHNDGDEVLRDLRRFCGINKGGIVVSPVTRMADPIATAYRAGQRDVFLRIAGFIGLDEAQLEEQRDVSNEPTDNGA